MGTKSISKFRFIVGAFVIVLICSQAETIPQNNKEIILDLQARTILQNFEKRIHEYVRLRDRLSRKLPKLPKQATPEQIEAHKTALQKSVQTSGLISKQGDFFSAPVVGSFAKIIKKEFSGRDLTELRKSVATADTDGVPLRVNVPYPEEKELLEMSPTLLLALPKLPDQVRYRFVGRNLLLVDQSHGLIVDIMPNAYA